LPISDLLWFLVRVLTPVGRSEEPVLDITSRESPALSGTAYAPVPRRIRVAFPPDGGEVYPTAQTVPPGVADTPHVVADMPSAGSSCVVAPAAVPSTRSGSYRPVDGDE